MSSSSRGGGGRRRALALVPLLLSASSSSSSSSSRRGIRVLASTTTTTRDSIFPKRRRDAVDGEEEGEKRVWSSRFTSSSSAASSNAPTIGSVVDAQLAFARGTLTSEDLVLFSKRKVDLDKHLANAFVKGREERSRKLMEKALETARGSDLNRKNGNASKSFLDGIPIAVKDNFAMRGEIVSAGSKMLRENEASYTATAIDRLENSGAVVFGQTTMDEFGMGSHSQNVLHPPTVKNPIDDRLSPGGSSGGSAAAVANGTCLVAIGSDTGGSVRLPAAFQGIVGTKPSYGRCSRYGLIAYASSFDCPGILTRNVCDAAITLAIMQGADPKDAHTVDEDGRISSVATELISESQMNFKEWLESGKTKGGGNGGSSSSSDKVLPLLGVRVGIPGEFFLEETTPAVMESWTKAIEAFEELGATIVPVSLPSVKLALPAYYVLVCAEASSNLNRYDEVKFSASRDEGFGEEVKRRIVSGAFSLSSQRVEGAYKNSEKIREKISNEFKDIFERSCDVLLTPTSAREAPFLEDVSRESKVESYAQDALTVPMSLAGLPSVSIPCGKSVARGRPIGMQVTAPMFREAGMLRVASALERKISSSNPQRRSYHSTSSTSSSSASSTNFPIEKLEEQLKLFHEYTENNDYKSAGELKSLASLYQKYKDTLEEIEVLRQLINEDNKNKKSTKDADLESELDVLQNETLPDLETKLKHQLLPKDPEDSRDVILEVRAGAGGAEAAKFAAELFRMYEMYARRRNWKFDLMSYTEEEKGGGVREAMAEIINNNNNNSMSSALNYDDGEHNDELANGGVYKNLKFESGVHRVQRVPATETQGRIHTSTASVAIIPKAEENDIHIDETKDVRIETMRASGAGGQHVNTTNSAVRIVHIPTGITVVIQDERSQHKNKAKALSVLRTRVYDIERRKVAEENAQMRRSLIGSADRSERIRTYNFKDGRCKDHRGSNVVVNDVEKLLDGFGLDEFIRDLHKCDLEEQMLNFNKV
jgi:peptide chain release factor 1